MEKQRCVKMDTIMKNMLMVALRDLFQEEKAKGIPVEDSRNLVLKLADYEGTKLFLADNEYKKVIEALNKLRNAYLAAGRYPDGIDVVFYKILKAKYKRCPAQ